LAEMSFIWPTLSAECVVRVCFWPRCPTFHICILQGHIFWDNEMYIIPAMLPMHPDKVRDILRYRAEMYEAALEEAKLRNEQGARY
jgi:hypothetical protein